MFFPSGEIKENTLYTKLLNCPQPLLFVNPNLEPFYLDLKDKFFSHEELISHTFHLSPYEDKTRLFFSGETLDKNTWQFEINDKLEGTFWYKDRKDKFSFISTSPRLASRRKKLLRIKRKNALLNGICFSRMH
jgi:hypothetical protein